mmetsp:Transcript_85863/g.278111  ORF Transcript_85863/g.278111 Transcript_85863/m.278111 type:complete len:209 (-) Transcript_85863:548-1174(-)
MPLWHGGHVRCAERWRPPSALLSQNCLEMKAVALGQPADTSRFLVKRGREAPKPALARPAHPRSTRAAIAAPPFPRGTSSSGTWRSGATPQHAGRAPRSALLWPSATLARGFMPVQGTLIAPSTHFPPWKTSLWRPCSALGVMSSSRLCGVPARKGAPMLQKILQYLLCARRSVAMLPCSVSWTPPTSGYLDQQDRRYLTHTSAFRAR